MRGPDGGEMGVFRGNFSHREYCRPIASFILLQIVRGFLGAFGRRI